MTTFLVAGAGYVGGELAARLASAGHVVYGLRRAPEGLPAGVRPLSADLLDRRALEAALPDGIERVAYTAAAGAGTDQAYADVYVSGLANLLGALAARRAPVGRVLFTSSTGVHAQQGGELVDEESPAEPTDATGRRLREGERLVEGGPFPGVVLRLGGIYGPTRTRLVEEVRAGRARRPAGRQFTNRIHRDDCAAAIEHLLALPAPASLYLGVDHEPADLGDVMTWIAARLGLPPPPVRAPGESESRARPERGHKRCSNARLVASGYRFAFPTFREGYSALIPQSAASASS